MTSLGLYVPGRSWVHRMPAGLKLALLLAVGIGVLLLRTPLTLGVALLAAFVVAALTRVGPRTWWAQLRPVLLVIIPLGLFHWWLLGWESAVLVTGRILLLVVLAAAVTLTTRTTALVDSVVTAIGPLRRVGIDPDRVGLIVALGIRCVPVVVGLAGEVRDAQRARGVGGSPRAFAVPLVLRSLHHADQLGDALAARGLDD